MIYFQSSIQAQYVSIRMSIFQESKKKEIKEDDCTSTLTRYMNIYTREMRL